MKEETFYFGKKYLGPFLKNQSWGIEISHPCQHKHNFLGCRDTENSECEGSWEEMIHPNLLCLTLRLTLTQSY